MKAILIAAAMLTPVVLQAQNGITSDIVEGGKTLVELIRIIRAPRLVAVVNSMPDIAYADSCNLKKQADISFKNRTGKTVEVNLYLRIGNAYDKNQLKLMLAPLTQESLYELKAGIYKYKIEVVEGEEKDILQEGELKLQPCEKLIREIK